MMEKNLGVYRSQQVVAWYSRMTALIPVEKKILETHAAFLKQSRMLDIGIGGGRTTGHLLRACKAYTGIDYSEKFVEAAQQAYPEANCLVMDARDLSLFTNTSFECVNFSFNGIDYVDGDGREKILAEVQRVLTPGGLFFFSTHNRRHRTFNAVPWRNADNSLLVNVKTFIKLAPFLFRKWTQKKNEEIRHDYALIRDSAHNYRLTTFYTDPAFLRTQLTAHGFGDIRFYKKSGELSADAGLDDWIFVTAKKISL